MQEEGVIVPMDVRKKMHLEGVELGEDGAIATGFEGRQNGSIGSVGKEATKSMAGEISV